MIAKSLVARLMQHQAPLMCVGALLILALIYAPTLLTQISGGRDADGKISPYMDDVGEIQVALNVWGTLHHTSYPLYTILGNLSVGVLRGLGVSAATAPALYTAGWGLIALVLFYVLLVRLTDEAIVAATCTVLLGLTRSIWTHNSIAEVYSMSLAITVLLLALALWPSEMSVRRRVWLLALVGGIGVAHHRLIGLLAPGLLLAVWPDLRAEGRRAVHILGMAILIGLIGFLPYLYLPARALAGGSWVYGDPSTLAGLWHEFTGAESQHLMRLPAGLGELWDDFNKTLRIITTELTPPIAVYSAVACLVVFGARFRREMQIILACTLPTLVYLVVQHRVVMPEATVMPIIVALVMALAFSLAALLDRTPYQRGELLIMIGLLAPLAAVSLRSAHVEFIRGLTQNQTGVRMIELAKRVPREGGQGVFWLPWGPNFTAVAFSAYVSGENADLSVAAHNDTDLRSLIAQGKSLYTAKDTFYLYPLAFWDAQLGRAYLSAAAEDVVAIRRQPLTAHNAGNADNAGNAEGLGEVVEVADGIVRRTASLCVTETTIHLTLVWGATRPPARDLSVFVHLLDADNPAPLAQADSRAPVYGWYPTSRWSAGEVVYDYYVLPQAPGGDRVRVGMYEQVDGRFVNYGETILSLTNALPCVATAAPQR